MASKELRIPFATSLVTFLLGVFLGIISVSSVADKSFLDSPQIISVGGNRHLDVFEIFSRNMSAALLLFSGVVTGGLSTLIGLILTSVYVGATFGIAANSVGLAQAAGSIVLYAPLEFLGLIIVATAGFWPAQRALGHIFSRGRAGVNVLAVYVHSLKDSLKILAVGSAVILLAAAAESLVIALR